MAAKTDAAGRRIAKKGEPALANYAEKDVPTVIQGFAEWLKAETGYEVDERSVYLASSLRGTFQKSEGNQKRIADRAAEIEQEKLDRVAKAEERAAAKVARDEAKAARAAEREAAAKQKVIDDAAEAKVAKAAPKAPAAKKAPAARATKATPAKPAAPTRRRPARGVKVNEEQGDF